MGWDLAQYQKNVTAGLIPANAHLFADDAAFQTVDAAGNAVPNATGAAYSIPEVPDYGTPIPGGDTRLSPLNVYIDVDKPAPSQSTVIRTDSRGFLVPFCAPAGLHKVWVDFGNGRVMLTASDLGDQIDSVVIPGTYQLKSEKNQANGYPGLDGNAKLASSQIPDLSATYQSKTAPNPWRYTMTVNDFGWVLKGVAGSTSQIFQVQDPNGSPIFSVGHVGGAAVYGDALKTFPPGDVFNPAVVIGDDGHIIASGANSGFTANGSTLVQADIDAVHAYEQALQPSGTNLAVVGNAFGQPKPSNHGLLAWTFDPAVATTSTAPVGKTLYLAAVYVAKSAPITKINWSVGSQAAVTPVSGHNWIGLYDSTGALKASASADTVITTANNFVTTVISSTILTPGMYWVAFLFDATTLPSVVRGGNISAGLANVGLSAASLRYATNGPATLIALPSTITPASNVASAIAFWAAIG